MIVIAGMVLGAVWGGYKARKRGGNRLDVAQYAVVNAIIFGLAGLLLTIVVGRMN